MKCREQTLAIELSWAIPERVLTANIKGDMTADELDAAFEHIAVAFEQQVGGMLGHIVLDIRDLQMGRQPSKALQQNVSLARNRRLGWLLLIAEREDSPLYASLISLARTHRLRFRLFRDVNEAMTFLMVADSTLSAMMSTRRPSSDGGA